ncbi:MAG: HAD hydrolase-like protein [Clostridia bacterium]|nr:HAD hydrolase-like protein [Clostridia bacterium]
MKKYYDVVMFDLDGTLVNTGISIINSIVYVLRKNHITVPAPEDRRKFVGPPIRTGLNKLCGLNASECDKIAKEYRAHFEKFNWTNNYIYPGISDLLDFLKSLGVYTAVATSRPYPFAMRIIKHRHLEDRFDFICAPEESNPGIPKKDLITNVLKNYHTLTDNDPQNTKAIMVGDTVYDIKGACEAKIDSVMVTYGFGTLQELENYQPTYCAYNVSELYQILFNH